MSLRQVMARLYREEARRMRELADQTHGHAKRMALKFAEDYDRLVEKYESGAFVAQDSCLACGFPLSLHEYEEGLKPSGVCGYRPSPR